MPLSQAYKALEDMVKEGKLRRIGISNYTIEDYEELKKEMTIKVRAASWGRMSI